MKEEKTLKAVQQSRQDLVNYMTDLIQRTTDESFKEDMREFRRYVDRFEPCKNLKAVELDRKITAMIREFREYRVKHDSILSRKNTDSAIGAEVYADANREMFDAVAGMLETMLTERRELDPPEELDKKALKKLSDHERGRYLSRLKRTENAEAIWGAEADIRVLQMQSIGIAAERKVNELKKEKILAALVADRNNDALRRMVAVLNRSIEAQRIEEANLAKQVEQIRAYITALENEQNEDVIGSLAHTGKNLADKFGKVHSRTKDKAEERRKASKKVDVIMDAAMDSMRENAETLGQSAADDIDMEIERFLQKQQELDLGSAGASGAGKTDKEESIR